MAKHNAKAICKEKTGMCLLEMFCYLLYDNIINDHYQYFIFLLQITKETHSFNFAEASFDDMHSFRTLENERMQKEHELRIKNMAEVHNQVMANLKLQNQILNKHLETLK